VTIDELEDLVARAMTQTGCEEQPSRRVRAVPNERAIRYYSMLGLLDPPTKHGRKAYYGPRHLLQLIAIKRFQAKSVPLKKIQEDLVNATNEALLEHSELQEGFWEQLRGTSEVNGRDRHQKAPEPRFWEELPALPPIPIAREAPTLCYPIAPGIKVFVDLSVNDASEIMERLVPELKKFAQRWRSRRPSAPGL
jgi:DNA-binding transcriptional MerR regulator